MYQSHICYVAIHINVLYLFQY
jgi:hypothetical protein